MNRMSIFNSPFLLGFDQFERTIDRISKLSSDTYPPYNVVKHDNMTYEIEMAVAGFKKDHIDIEVKDHVMTIKGDRPKRRENEAYVHKGISARRFERSFRLSEYTEVDGADIQDGILTVNLKVVLPEEKRPRKITIN